MAATSKVRFESAVKDLLTEERAIKKMKLIERQLIRDVGVDEDSETFLEFNKYRDIVESIAAYQDIAVQSEQMMRLWQLTIAIDQANLRYPLTTKLKTPEYTTEAFRDEALALYHTNIMLDTITNMTESDVSIKILEFGKYYEMKLTPGSKLKFRVIFDRSLENNNMHVTIERGGIKLVKWTENLDILTGSCSLSTEDTANKRPISVNTTELTEFLYRKFLDANYRKQFDNLEYAVDNFFKVGKIVCTDEQYNITMDRLDERFNKSLIKAYNIMIKLSTPVKIEDMVHSVTTELTDAVEECIDNQSIIIKVYDKLNTKDKAEQKRIQAKLKEIHEFSSVLISDKMNEPFDISMHSHPLWQALLKYSELHDELQELIKVNTVAETSKGEVTEK